VDVICRRCGQTRAGLERAPLPGRWGAAVLEGTCAECWREWIEEQTRLINHERLTPSDPAHRQVLYERLGAFLRLEA
jgi:Fe-S cluster biosynthesis and repair protein YggX